MTRLAHPWCWWDDESSPFWGYSLQCVSNFWIRTAYSSSPSSGSTGFSLKATASMTGDSYLPFPYHRSIWELIRQWIWQCVNEGSFRSWSRVYSLWAWGKRTCGVFSKRKWWWWNRCRAGGSWGREGWVAGWISSFQIVVAAFHIGTNLIACRLGIVRGDKVVVPHWRYDGWLR